MRVPDPSLIDAFWRTIEMDDEFASEIAEVARQCAQDGNEPLSIALSNMARNHRIRGMESRAKLAALTGEQV